MTLEFDYSLIAVNKANIKKAVLSTPPDLPNCRELFSTLSITVNQSEVPLS